MIGHNRRSLLGLTVCLAVVWCVIQGSAHSADVQKHPLDKSEYRHLVLDNGLRVLLVSDPKFNKSAAAMLVEVGSLNNPRERQGLAHFLEHMLFLGTEKYPGVDDYGSYLTQNGGYDNAYTAGDHTNYHFQVNHEALDGALDRFAQFFIAPLFTEKYTERERNAVHSEHQKNLENDVWRTYQVFRTFYRPDHPASMFSTGSNETLMGTTREELLDFYAKYYSANRMNLALLGKASIDTLQAWTEEHFSAVPNRNLSRPTFEPDYLPKKETYRLVQIEPVKDLRKLEIEFPMPTFVDDYRSKPAVVLGSLIGHEGKGSLLSLLKQEDLATALGAGGYLNTQDYGGFNIQVDLTPNGLENYRDVVRLCLTYIDLLKASPFPAYYFEEMKSKARLDEVYSDRGEGGGYATQLNERMSRYPLEVAERVQFMLDTPDPKAYGRLLAQMRPDNMFAVLTAKGLETTDTEPHYGTQYSVTEDDAFYETLMDLPKRPELHLPEPNVFMPKQASIPDREVKEDVKPKKVLDEPGLTLYHSQDHEFLRPKVSIQFKIRFPADRMNLRFKVLLDTYTACVNESLNELAYPALTAGLGYQFANGYEGVYFTINGFDETAGKLFKSFLADMQNPRISEETFEALKDRTARGLKDFSKGNAYAIVSTRLREQVQAVNYPPEKRLTVVEGLTLPDLQAFAKSLYNQAYIEALVHGNTSLGRAVHLAKLLKVTLGVKAIPKSATFEQTHLVQPGPESITRMVKLEVNNSAIWRYYYLGPSTPQNRAAVKILSAFVKEPFFTEMRTNQQLGYIVQGVARTLRGDPDHGYLDFLIQSSTHTADDLEDRADAFISTYPERLAKLSQEDYDTFRLAAIEKLKEKAKTIAEKAGEFNTQAFALDGNFDYEQETITALETLKKADVEKILTNTIGKDTRRIRTTLGFARQHEAKREVASSFEDLESWKKTRVFE